MPLLAVYGTLKRNYANHEKYLRGCRFVGTGWTVEKYVLVDDGIPFCIPPEIYGPGAKPVNIRVEVYDISDEKLSEIDELEGHPNWYIRKKVKVKLDGDGVVEAWFYEYPERVKGKVIESGEW